MEKIEHHLGQPLARLSYDNTNEFLRKLLLRHFGLKSVAMDSTMAHALQENEDLERANCTIMPRVRASLMDLCLQFNKEDTISKNN